MTSTVETDVVIVGAGIAGLWLNQYLREQGYSTLLLEKTALGGMQSMGSQGIIHGGTKYTLHGSLSTAANAISDMPRRWRTSMEGNGDIDLRGTNLLSEHHYLWSRDKMMSKMTTFFASKAVKGKVKETTPETRPEAFRHPDFTGSCYALNEMVLDLPSLINTMAKACPQGIYKYDCSQPGTFEFSDETVSTLVLRNKDQSVSVKAQRYIFTAGEGNEAVLKAAHLNQPAMQKRPLHMVLVKHQCPYPIYAHCVGASPNPLVTITTHYMQNGQPVWYLGGNLAENGVGLDQETQISKGKALIKELLPWLNLGETTWSSFTIQRAEPKQQNMLRPDTAYLNKKNNIITCWPTKLALAPNLGDAVLNQLKEDHITPKFTTGYNELGFLNRPHVAIPIWEDLLI